MARLHKNEAPKVSALIRVFAWILVFGSAMVAVSAAIDIYRYKGWPWSAEATMVVLFSFGLCLPLFLYVAFKGRSPLWWASMEKDASNRLEVLTRGDRAAKSNVIKNLTWVVASLVTGVLLMQFGKSVGLFESETRWLEITLFGIAWLICSALLWRYFRHK